MDDDCDGRVDETFPLLGRSCWAGLGECAAEGSVECDPVDPSRTRCNAVRLPPPEPERELTCTGGHDEDCDGFVDHWDPDCVFDPGRELPSRVDLPVTVDCCAVSGPECVLRDYCSVVAEPVNPCTTSTGEMVSCLQLGIRLDQNACWSTLDDQTRGVSSVSLLGVLRDGPITAESKPVWIDSGSRSPVYIEMRDLMLGTGRYAGNPAGSDRYLDVPGIDSWVVRLPVVECQASGNHCSSASVQEIVGALCFEVREIEAFPPEPVVRGRFLCPETDPELFALCELGPDFVD